MTTRRRLALMSTVALLGVSTAVAHTSAPPVGPLPAGAKTVVSTRVGQLVAVALPHQSGGKVWRIARAFDGATLSQVSEGDLGSNVVLVFSAKKPGTVTLVFALTKGETSKALAARTYIVHIS
jgi:hypothetical protein